MPATLTSSPESAASPGAEAPALGSSINAQGGAALIRLQEKAFAAAPNRIDLQLYLHGADERSHRCSEPFWCIVSSWFPTTTQPVSSPS